MDTSTTYLGLRLEHPFMAGASPLSAELDSVKRLEDAGVAAIVLHSLFEEQITQAASGRIHQMDPVDRQFAPVHDAASLAQWITSTPGLGIASFWVARDQQGRIAGFLAAWDQ